MKPTPSTLKLIEPASPEALVPAAGWSLWLIIAGIVIALIIAAIILIRVLLKKSSAPSPAALRESAFREALAALHAVKSTQTRDAAVQSSLIVRKYLAAAAADPALYETHEEFISRHDSLQSLTPDARSAAETGFTRLALLKYAPDIPDEAPEAILEESQVLLEALHHGFAA